MRKVSSDCQSGHIDERRKEARYTLILRAAVLEQQGRSSLCLVKNVSTCGIQIRFYSRPLPEVDASIRVADEQSVSGRILWVEGNIAGMSFDRELDSASLLRVQQKLRPNRRRSLPRVNVAALATLRTAGRTCRAEVCDISSQGVRIRTKAALNSGDRAIIALADLPALNAYVRWSYGNESGLVFETPIPIQIIAGWIEGRVNLTA